MHIPDGFINVATAATTYAVSAGAIAGAVRSVNRKMGEKQVPLMGIMAAFVFAAQMLNFPVAGGTSGHFLGAALAAILLGPRAGLLVIACVLIVQSLLFQDGGLVALGANILNMGVVGSFVSYYVYWAMTAVLGEGKRGRMTGSFLSAWFSVVLAAIATAAELALSGTSPWGVVLPAMAGVHALIGIAEGVVTAAAIALVMATRPDLLPSRAAREVKSEA